MRRRNPYNEDGVGQPSESVYGQAMRHSQARLMGAAAPVYTSNVRDGARGFRDRFGSQLNVVPYPPPLVQVRTGYAGRVPLSLLGSMVRPHAWE